MIDETAPRLLLAADLCDGALTAGTPAQAHHLATVLRRKPGDSVRLFNGRDGEFAGIIARLSRDQVSFAVAAQTREPTAEPDIWLVFSPLKRDATDLIVQKATELGASALLPVFCARTNTARVNEARLTAIAADAAEQSERLTVPAIHPPRRLLSVLGDWPRDRVLAAALERAPHLPRCGRERAGGLLVGPEGGFTLDELDVMRAAPFIQPVSLGARILRAETACLAGLAILLSRDW